MSFSNQFIEEFYKENFDSLVVKLSRKAGSVENAEDVVQETFYRCLAYRHTFINGSRFTSWFNQVLTNTFKDFKNEEKLQGMSIEFDEEKAEPIEMKMPYNSLMKKADRLIKEKDEEIQPILSLYFLSGYKPRDIHKLYPAFSASNIRKIVQRFKEEIE